MTDPLRIQGCHLPEAFYGEITSETVCSFQGRLVELVREYKNDPRLILLFKEVLEAVDKVDAGKNDRSPRRQERFQRQEALKEDEVSQLAFNVLFSEEMKTMLRSGIEALESKRPEEILRGLSFSEEVSLYREHLSKIVLPILKLIPQEDISRSLCLSSIRLFENIGVHDFRNFNDVLSTIGDIPKEQRAGLIEHAASALEGIEIGDFLSSVFTAILNISVELRSNVIEAARPILKGVKEGCEAKFILEAMQDIPPEHRSDVIEKAGPLFGRNSNGYQRGGILTAIRNIAPDQRADVIEKSLPLLTSVTNVTQKAVVLTAVGKIPEGERTDVIEKAKPFFEDVSDGNKRAGILEIIGRIPERQREAVIELTGPLFEGATGVYRKERILEAMSNAPEEQRVDLVKLATSAFEGITEGYRRESVFLAIEKLAPEERAEAVKVANACKSLTKEIVLRTWLRIPSGTRSSAWKTLLVQLDKIHAPALQTKAFVILQEALRNPKEIDFFTSSEMGALFPKESTQIFRLFATGFWVDRGIDESLDVIAAVLHSKGFKEVDRKKTVLGAFWALLSTRLLSSEEKRGILAVIFPKNDVKAIPSLQNRLKMTQALRNSSEVESSVGSKSEKVLIGEINRSLLLMETIGNFGRFADLKRIEKPSDLVSILEGILRTTLNMDETDDCFERYLETFGSFRDAASLPVYMSKSENLPPAEKSAVSDALKIYVREVSVGTFSASRYEEASSQHLRKVFIGRQELKRRWTAGKKMDFEEIFSSDALPEVIRAFDAKEYLKQRVLTDTHISHEKVPYLVAYLTESEGNLPNLAEEIRDLEREVERNLQDQTLRQRLDRLKLQKGLLVLLEDAGDSRYEIFRSKVEPFIKTDPAGEEQFGSDLVGLGKMLAPRGKKISFAGWTLVDTDEPQDLMLCGTEVEGSCQNIRGNAQYNKCLLAYLLDGKNRLIAVKDPKGRIVARSILRILWDETKQAPVLFKERVYSSSHADAKVTEALDRMCVLRGRELELPLVIESSSDSEATLYPNELESLGSRAPFEYTDAGGGITSGTFKVRGELVADFSVGGLS